MIARTSCHDLKRAAACVIQSAFPFGLPGSSSHPISPINNGLCRDAAKSCARLEDLVGAPPSASVVVPIHTDDVVVRRRPRGRSPTRAAERRGREGPDPGDVRGSLHIEHMNDVVEGRAVLVRRPH